MTAATRFRSGAHALSVRSGREITAVVNRVGMEDIEALRAALDASVPAVVEGYSNAAAWLAADHYDGARTAAGSSGGFRALIDTSRSGGAAELLDWVWPTFVDGDWDAALQLLLGGVQRRVSNGARDTIARSVFEDKAAMGWQRSTAPGACDFCQMLAGRGAVYKEETVSFASHDNCGCMAVPAFRGKPVPVRNYVPSRRNINDADRARVRRYLASHKVG